MMRFLLLRILIVSTDCEHVCPQTAKIMRIVAGDAGMMIDFSHDYDDHFVVRVSMIVQVLDDNLPWLVSLPEA